MTPEFAVLTPMITPAVLISARAALILSTSTRLGRVPGVATNLASDLPIDPRARPVVY